MARPRRRLTSNLSHEDRVVGLALLSGAFGSVTALALLWLEDHSLKVQSTLTCVILLGWLGFGLAVRDRVARPLQTLSMLLEALREGDYTFRARLTRGDDALSAVFTEVNALTRSMEQHRISALEAFALLRAVMDEIKVAVFAFDEAERLRLVNWEGQRLLGENKLLPYGRTAEALGLKACLQGSVPRRLELALPGGLGPWELRRGVFRQEGLPHQLVMLADLRRALRDEEREAWQRLVRVLGHEINNSLAPIHSISKNLQAVAQRPTRAPDFDTDLLQGLEVISRRSEALNRFMSAYARLARLPSPKLAPVSVSGWIARGVGLEQRKSVQVIPGPDFFVDGDEDQLEQLLINLLRNAVDASNDTGGDVVISWAAVDGELEVRILDEGHGLAETANLFVPFFTTKPKGSGIGLVLSRQIAEAHDGSLTLKNRTDRSGCEAVLKLPFRAS